MAVRTLAMQDRAEGPDLPCSLESGTLGLSPKKALLLHPQGELRPEVVLSLSTGTLAILSLMLKLVLSGKFHLSQLQSTRKVL